MAYLIFNPDPTVVWAHAHWLRDAELLRRLDGTTHVIASNPPESAHVGGARLAHRLGAKFVMDMRDGWLDEPLRPSLQTSSLRRWREGRLERRCVARAQAIIVTSDTWKGLLTRRYPSAASRVRVVTNAYPPPSMYERKRGVPSDAGRLQLVHAGRFEGSDPRRNPRLLLEPVLDALQERNDSGEVLLPGAHSTRDLATFTRLRQRMPDGWRLEAREPMPRANLLGVLADASGLLLLTASQSQIPAKLFEYLPTGRPILVVAPSDSEVVRFCSAIGHVFTITPHHHDTPRIVEDFLDACSDPALRPIPAEYSHEALGRKFVGILAET